MSSKSVISISSHVARGSVGNRASVFAFEVLRVPVWSVHTISLPWHPGHGPATRIVPDSEQFDSFLEDIARSSWIDEVGGILTGYMANPDQVRSVAELIKTLKRKNTDLVYLCDPVIGDAAGLYVKEDVAVAIRDQLIPISDLATPNRYELRWLSNTDDVQDLTSLVKASRDLGPEQMLVTSAPVMMKGYTGNLLITSKAVMMAEHREIQNPPNGPGDLTAAIFLAHLLAGIPASENLQKTTASVFEILSQAKRRQSDELMLETDSGSIIAPRAQIAIRNLR